MRVLLIEDDPPTATLVGEMLQPTSVRVVHHARLLTEAMGWLATTSVDAVLLDLHLPDGDDGPGRIRAAHPHLPIVLLSGKPQDVIIRTALEQGARAGLSKSDIDADLLVRALERARHRMLPDRWQDHTRRLATLLRLASRPLPATTRIEKVLTLAREELGMALAVAAQVEEGTYVVDRASAASGGPAVGTRGPLSDGLPARVLAAGRVVTVDPGGWSHPVLDGVVRCGIGVPLRVDGLAYGVLDLSSPSGHRAWDDTDVDYVEHVAALVARWTGEDRRSRALADLSTALEQQSLRDELTGLGNRRMLDLRLERQIAIEQAHDRTCAVLYIDLDGFKGVNDAAGHAAGDLALRAAARSIAGAVRTGDLVTRVGGDEFVVVLTGPQDVTTTVEVASAIHEAVAAAPTSGSGVVLGASIGAALVGAADDLDGPGILKRADAALYRAKAEGGRTLRWADPAPA